MFVRKNLWKPVFEGEGTPPPGTPPAGTPPAGTTFTQEQVNAMIAKEKRAWQTREGELVKKLENLDLTVAQKEKLEGELESVRQASMTEQEKAKDILDKATKKAAKEFDTLKADRDSINTRYVNEKMDRELLDAAIEHGAYRPPQLTAILKNQARVAEELAPDGTKTGRLVTKVKFDTVVEGKPVVLDLSASEAVKKMKEDVDRFGNLFAAPQTGGLGGQGPGRAPGAGGDVSKMSTAEVVALWNKSPEAAMAMLNNSK